MPFAKQSEIAQNLASHLQFIQFKRNMFINDRLHGLSDVICLRVKIRIFRTLI